jgi:hypothetical protein
MATYLKKLLDLFAAKDAPPVKDPNFILGAWGKMIHDKKNLKQKISF